MTLPNFITIARIFMVPAIVWLLFAEAYQPAFFLFLLAGLSDALDGFVAKQFNQRSELGAYLDPLADKVMLVAIYVLLGIFDHLPNWLVILVVSRDVAIVGAVMLAWLLDKPMKMEPTCCPRPTPQCRYCWWHWCLAGLQSDQSRRTWPPLQLY
jgi:cardiolipin synthase